MVVKIGVGFMYESKSGPQCMEESGGTDVGCDLAGVGEPGDGSGLLVLGGGGEGNDVDCGLASGGDGSGLLVLGGGGEGTDVDCGLASGGDGRGLLFLGGSGGGTTEARRGGTGGLLIGLVTVYVNDALDDNTAGRSTPPLILYTCVGWDSKWFPASRSPRVQFAHIS